MNIILFLTMFAMHIIGDWVLQTDKMTNLKQKGWWSANWGFKKNEKDYLSVLCIHSYLWTFCMMLPIFAIILYKSDSVPIVPAILMFIMNFVVHIFVDDLKANKDAINLIQDQIIHALQVLITFIVFVILSK